MKTLIALFAILALTLIAAAQPPPDTLWTRTFGGIGEEVGYSVQQTSDGGYIVTGSIDSSGSGGNLDVYLIKTDFNGNERWQKTFGGGTWDVGNSVQQTSDGGYIIVGTSDPNYNMDVYLIKTDHNGNLSWSRTFGGTDVDIGHCVQQTADGGYIIIGYTQSFGSGSTDVYLIKTDAYGNESWHRIFGGSGSALGMSVQQTSDSGYIIAGYTDSYGAGNYDVYLIKTDINGNQVWQRTFGGSNNDYGYSVQQTSDGGYIIAGYTESYGSGLADVYLIKTNAAGYESWHSTFGGSNYDKSFSVQQTNDGGYVLAGATNSFGSGYWDVYSIKTDVSGNQVWQSTYGGSNLDAGYSVLQTSDGGYVIAGYTASYGAGLDDVYLIKTDAAGDTVWTHTFGGNSWDEGRCVQQTADGGYIVVGTTESYGAGDVDVYLIKTDTNGDSIWTRTFGGNLDDYGYSVQQTTDGGYVIAGFTESYGAGNDDVYLIKTDELGNATW